MTVIARQAVATGVDAAWIAQSLADQLAGPDLKLVIVFADWRLDARAIAGIYRALRVPVVGGSTTGVIGKNAPLGQDGVTSIACAVGVGLYGDWLRVGLGVAPELSKSALSRSRDAVTMAATALGTTPAALDPQKHVAITVLDGTCGHEEAFCIGSAAAAPQIRFVGGCAWTVGPPRDTIWINGESMRDAGAVVLLESQLPFFSIASTHMVPTDTKTVVTGVDHRIVTELDGYPAAARLRHLVAQLGDTLDEPQPMHTFARYVENTPYIRSIYRVEGDAIVETAAPVEVGRVLRIMRPGDLVGTTTRDLAAAAERVGGTIGALLAFSCHGRHWEARQKTIERGLVDCYMHYPTIGYETGGEQSGMLLVNHTLTGLAIGAPK